MLINYHVHSNTSLDAKNTLSEMAEEAERLGFDEICITNHHDFSPIGGETFMLSKKKINGLKKEIAGLGLNLKIKLGIELGYDEGYEKEILELSKHGFDYVIGSIHVIEDTYLWEHDRPDNDLMHKYETYFATLKKLIKLGYCDCIGHFDIFKKYVDIIDYRKYRDLVMACIEEMKRNDTGFELNTSGWHRYNLHQFPCTEILRDLHDSGIKKVTIGADSHDVTELKLDIDKGVSLLKEIGFKQLCTFDKRKAIYHNI